MKNLQFKTGCSGAALAKRMSAYDSLHLMAAAGIRNIDFWFHKYGRTETDPLFCEDWKEWTQRLCTALQENGQTVTQAHAPTIMKIPRDFHYESPLPMFHRCIEACAMLGCQTLIFHPVFYKGRIPDRETHDAIMAYNIRWFRELAPVLNSFGVTGLLENTFDFGCYQQEGDPPFFFTTAEDMLALLDGARADNYALCLDTGHANLAGQDLPDMVRRLGSALQALHLNDNTGINTGPSADVHLFPGEGTISWDSVFSALREIGFSAIYNMEPVADLALLDSKQIISRLNTAQNRLQHLLRLAENRKD